jgi:hypothetical protein
VHVRPVLGDRERIVEVLGGLRVDRERELIAQVDAAFRADGRRIVGLEAAQLALLDEQAFEDGLNLVRRAEDTLDACPAAALADEGEVARLRVSSALAVEEQRRARNEVGLPDEVLASPRELDYYVLIRPGGNGGS